MPPYPNINEVFVKKILSASGVAAVLLLTTAACGGPSADEKKASASMAKAWDGTDATKARKANNACIAEKWVAASGVDTLVKEKVLDKNFRAIGQAPPAKLGKTAAKDFGNAVADCYDIKALKDDLKQSMQGLDDKTVDAYITCMDGIDRDLIAQAVADGKTGKTATNSKPMKDLEAVVKTCQEKVQK